MKLTKKKKLPGAHALQFSGAIHAEREEQFPVQIG